MKMSTDENKAKLPCYTYTIKKFMVLKLSQLTNNYFN